MQIAADRPETPTAIRTDLGAIFVSLELSRSTWLGQKMPKATPAMTDVISRPFRFPAVGGKKVSAAAFDGGRITSDGGVLLLAQAESEMGICAQLAACIVDPRNLSRVVHRLDDILRGRVLAIACGYDAALFRSIGAALRPAPT